jgi:hypothetical protein
MVERLAAATPKPASTARLYQPAAAALSRATPTPWSRQTPRLNIAFGNPVSAPLVQRRKFEFESKIEATVKAVYHNLVLSALDTGAFNLGLIGSTCTALPWCATERPARARSYRCANLPIEA